MAVTAETDMAADREDDVRERLAGLFDRHHPKLFRVARRMSGSADDAHDLVQETFLRVARRPAGLPDEEPDAEAWLVRILVNLCRDRRRWIAVRHRGRDRLEPTVTPDADPESAAVARATVQRALARLKPRRRAIVVLHEYEEMSLHEIGALLGLHKTTVRWHLLAARKELARFLGAKRRRSSGGRK